MSHERAPEAALTRVLVIDANPMVSELLVVLLRGQPGLECTGRAHTTPEAHRRFTLDHPDVVVLPAHVGTTDGLDLATELLELDPATRVVVTSGSSDCAQVLRAARSAAALTTSVSTPVIAAERRLAMPSSNSLTSAKPSARYPTDGGPNSNSR